jgi:hypothetical protein
VKKAFFFILYKEVFFFLIIQGVMYGVIGALQILATRAIMRFHHTVEIERKERWPDTKTVRNLIPLC